jgi:hypothetical protein
MHKGTSEAEFQQPYLQMLTFEFHKFFTYSSFDLFQLFKNLEAILHLYLKHICVGVFGSSVKAFPVLGKWYSLLNLLKSLGSGLGLGTSKLPSTQNLRRQYMVGSCET